MPLRIPAAATRHTVSAALFLLLVAPAHTALVLDECRASVDCTTEEIDPSQSISCIVVNRGAVGEGCSEDYPTCRCIPSRFEGFKPCTSDLDCITGEVCVVYTPGTNGTLTQLGRSYEVDEPFCASEAAEERLGDIERFPRPDPPTSPTGNDTVVDDTNPVSMTRGLTLAECNTDDDCARTHSFQSCETLSRGTVGDSCFGGTIGCRCMPSFENFIQCNSNEDCLVGEVCVMFTGEERDPLTELDNLDHTRPFCVSAQAVASLDDVKPLEAEETPNVSDPSGSDSPGDGGENTGGGGENTGGDGVCIAAKSLGHLSPAQLVFSKHVLSKVLCDENGSCATRGHMVVFRGNPMRMSKYCRDYASCEVQTMKVNSPHYERALRIGSDTAELEFTALAARFNTRAEEMVLSVAVRAAL